MAPLLGKDHGPMLGQGNGSDALLSDTTVLIGVGVVALTAVASLVLIIFGCGCGGNAENEAPKEGKAEEVRNFQKFQFFKINR